MKTKELIRQLQEADPEGETECNVGGKDIYFVENLPGYHDGPYEVLLRADHKKPYYDIVGIRICRQGRKIDIRTLGVDDFLLGDPDGLVQFDCESARERQEPTIEQYRAENKRIIAECDAQRDAAFEKDKEKILTNSKDKDLGLARFLQGILTKAVHTEFGQTLFADGTPLKFDLPNVPDERKEKAREIFAKVYALLEELK